MAGTPLFAAHGDGTQASRPIESRSLEPLNASQGTAGQTVAGGPITTPPSLRERGWTVEGAPIVEVSAGDTAATLSTGFGVPVGVILEANALSDAADVRPGQRLVIPTYVYRETPQETADRPVQIASADPNATFAVPRAGPGAPPTTLNAQASEGRHVVQPGDTLTSLAVLYRVSRTDLARLNNLDPNGQVQVGQQLRVPPPTGTPSAAPAVATARPAVEVASLEPTAVAPAVQAPGEAQPANASQPVDPAPAAAVVAPGEGTGFRWPVRGRIITGFGKQADGARNDGINLAVPAGTPVHAAESGTVIYAGDELEGYGNLILVQHPDDWVSAYAHNDQLKVQRGDTVKRGQAIASVGKSGSVEQPQLHFELRRRSKPVDPLPHLSGA